LKDSVAFGKDFISDFDSSVFDGHYVTGDIDAAYLERLDQKRNDAAKVKPDVAEHEDETPADLHTKIQ
jgi:amidophosphoribosyltransferase